MTIDKVCLGCAHAQEGMLITNLKLLKIMKQSEIRTNLSRRYYNVRRDQKGIWWAQDPERGTVIARRKKIRIGDDAAAEAEAEMYQRIN